MRKLKIAKDFFALEIGKFSLLSVLHLVPFSDMEVNEKENTGLNNLYSLSS